MYSEVSAIILGAGRGKRIGHPKIFLKMNGQYFLDIIYDALRDSGVNDIHCTFIESWRQEKFACRDSLHWIVNEAPERGMISSVYFGINALPKKQQACIIFPVDHPLVKRETIQLLLANWKDNRDKIIIPKFAERGGHPVILPKNMFVEIKRNKFELNLRELIRLAGRQTVEVEVRDEGVTLNMNEKKDLRRIAGDE